MRHAARLALTALLTISSFAMPRAAESAKAEPKGPGGRLAAESEVVDAGAVVRGEVATFTFVLKNTGTENLTIVNVKPSCGCTVATFDKAIAPGATGKVTAQLKTENFRGAVEKIITVTSNDPTNENMTLRLKANVVGSAQILPRPGLALPGGQDWEYTGKLIIRKDETEKGELALTDLTTSAPWLVAKARKVEQVEVAAAGMPEAQPGDYVIDISVADDAPKTAGGFQITFKTGLPREPVLTVPVSVVLESAMRVYPSPLYFQATKDGTPAEVTTTAWLRPGLGKDKLTAQASPEAFHVELQPAGPRKYKVVVTWRPVGDNPPTEGNMVLRVGDESQTVLLRVVGAPRPASAAAAPSKTALAAEPGVAAHSR